MSTVAPVQFSLEPLDGDKAALQAELDRVERTDFQGYEEAFRREVGEALVASLITGDMSQRAAEQRAFLFLSGHQVHWQRFALHTRWLELQSPRKSPPWDDEEEDCGIDLHEAGRVLIQWITTSYYARTRRRRMLGNVGDRPYWQLVSGGCIYTAHLKADGTTRRWDDAFWSARQVPGDRLECKCRVRALTEHEVAQKSAPTEGAS